MQGNIGEILDNDGDINDTCEIDRSACEHLDTHEFLALRNVARIFQSMEFEWVPKTAPEPDLPHPGV